MVCLVPEVVMFQSYCLPRTAYTITDVRRGPIPILLPHMATPALHRALRFMVLVPLYGPPIWNPFINYSLKHHSTPDTKQGPILQTRHKKDSRLGNPFGCRPPPPCLKTPRQRAAQEPRVDPGRVGEKLRVGRRCQQVAHFQLWATSGESRN